MENISLRTKRNQLGRHLTEDQMNQVKKAIRERLMRDGHKGLQRHYATESIFIKFDECHGSMGEDWDLIDFILDWEQDNRK